MSLARVDITTAGSAGSATGSGQTLPLSGVLGFIQVDYHGSAPGTTDVTITEAGAPGRTILTLTNRNTDGMFYPNVSFTDSTGSAYATASYGAWVLAGTPLLVSVAGCDALTDAVKVTFGYLKG